jgi:CubicO group peptidase (beta-lactamase class C family)
MVFIKPGDYHLKELNVDPGRLEYLDSFLKQITESAPNKFSAVRVLRYGEVIFDGGYGVQTPNGGPLREDAIYPLASITKSFTATLIAILQEDGLIDVWDKLNTYYPEFTGGKKDEVEIWQVMAHCSGISGETMYQYLTDTVKEYSGLDISEDCSWEDYSAALLKTRSALGLPKIEPVEKAVEETETALNLRTPLGYDPGTTFSYCDTGYQLLAKLVERLTGEDIDSYAARRLFKPLGMTDTHFLLPKEKWLRYVRRDPTFHFADWLNSDDLLTSTHGAAGLKSTMRDMTRFGQMWLQKGTLDDARILSPASIRLMTADHNAKLPPSYWGTRWLSSSWGLGWNVSYGKKDDLGLLRSDSTFDHAGAGGARLFIDPDNGLVTAMYTVELEAMSYENQSRIANIIYSALD